MAAPETFRFDEAVRKVLEFDGDPRPVIADPKATYYGVELGEETLVPGANARLGRTTLNWWLANVPAPPKLKTAAVEPVH